MSSGKKTVLVLFNQIEKDEYEAMRAIDPASLDFTPSYTIHVATIQEEYDAIVNALRAEGFEASCVNLRDDVSRLHKLVAQNPPDVIFNLVELFHNDLQREGAVAGFYELYRVRYTGASAFCLSLCRRKSLTKSVLLQYGLATPKFLTLENPVIKRNHGLRYPLIIKPSWQDGSAGVEACSVVYDYAHLKKQLESVYQRFQMPILVEEFIEGKELHISILGNNPPVALPVIEYDFSQLDADHPPVITYDVKWNPLALPYHCVHSLCPAQIDKKTEKMVMELALRAYAATYCRDYARVDLRLGNDGIPYILEVNPNPDLTEGVSFMESAEKAGISFSETLRRLVMFALERNP
ncbi:MAG TPA: ATP-grasp domain-containing protein [Acidobacteriota bacterium]|nr:ATP-grasp domain-containing protein [Acidobacteriota bacterium]